MALTAEEHKQRHVELHRALDELFADYFSHGHDFDKDGPKLTQIPIITLIKWSNKQAQGPDHEDRGI